MSYENLLNLTVVIRSKTGTQSNTGGVSNIWADKITGVKTRKTRNTEPKIYDDIAKVYIDKYKFYFKVDEDIEKENRILLSDGREYEILNIDTDSSNHHKKAYAMITQQ